MEGAILNCSRDIETATHIPFLVYSKNIEYLLSARQCSSYWGHSSEHNRQKILTTHILVAETGNHCDTW